MKTKNLFFPFKGINDIAFGMTRNEVRELLNAPFKTFKRGGEFAKTPLTIITAMAFLLSTMKMIFLMQLS